jgi:putative acetyltransferase
MITLRQAKPEDAEKIWHIHTRAIRETLGGHYTSEQIEAWAGGFIFEGYVTAMLAHPFLVAVEDETMIVGFAELSVDLSQVRSVYISPDFLRHGIGRELLDALEEISQSNGVSELVVDSSLQAEPFYNALGFESLERSIHLLRGGRAEIECVRMCKRLD